MPNQWAKKIAFATNFRKNLPATILRTSTIDDTVENMVKKEQGGFQIAWYSLTKSYQTMMSDDGMWSAPVLTDRIECAGG